MLRRVLFILALFIGSLAVQAGGDDKTFDVYPNPAVDEVVFHFEGDMAIKGGTISIYNTIGVLVGQVPVGPSVDFRFKIPQQWTPGLYIVTFEDTDGALTAPIKLTIKSTI